MYMHYVLSIVLWFVRLITPPLQTFYFLLLNFHDKILHFLINIFIYNYGVLKAIIRNTSLIICIISPVVTQLITLFYILFEES